jgi:hypothetical protein
MAGRLLYSPREGMSSKVPEEERKEPENKFSSTKTPRERPSFGNRGDPEFVGANGKATIIPLYREARVEVPRFRP